ncbi:MULTISPECIES: hypothetical protein [Streptomyces]|uniref:hypothetical protein n=1 Tax=Streptomyces TaxID=1883 RepID=UPI0004CD2A87|nr:MULTISPECIES: hypothetical protein [Streptomyces]KOT47265.1 hypothetical protein ADK43_39930 [Streptomyces rimosus subsp. rimosus]
MSGAEARTGAPGQLYRDLASAPEAAAALYVEVTARRALVLNLSWTHSSFADLVLAHGRWYAPAPWPGGPRRPGRCFEAAHAWADARGWTYCEGYALAADPRIGAFEHAWCLTRAGQVADPAARDCEVRVYAGVPLTDTFRRAQGRGPDAVLTFGHDIVRVQPNRAVLRDGLPPHALAPAVVPGPCPREEK